jgi:leishmanolysin-like peptidase
MGSHWEKRVFSDDYMTGHVGTSEPGYSKVTFALLEDSGYYKVNYEYVIPMRYGKNAGCDFLNLKCFTREISTSPLFCGDTTIK